MIKPTKKQIEAAELVFIAMAMVEHLQPIVIGYQKRILEAYRWKADSDNWGDDLKDLTITDPEKSWLLSKADFEIYSTECKKAVKENKLYVVNDEFCPLLSAEKDLVNAETLLLQEMAETKEFKEFSKIADGLASIQIRKNAISLCLKFLSPYVRDAKAILQKIAA